MTVNSATCDWNPRYDVRGALCELAPHEAPPGGYGNRLEYLSAEEQRAEQLCEEERYLFLYNNEEELRLRQGEWHGDLVIPPDPTIWVGVSI